MRILLAAAALAVVACSSSGPAAPKQKAEIPPPDFEIRQLIGPAELNYEPGAIEVKFRLDIGNRAGIPMTLRRIEIMTVNPEGGAYTLDASHRAYYFNKTINSQEKAAVDFWAKAYSYGRSTRENEPVTVRGTLYFQTPNGYYNHVFVTEIGQYPGQND